MHKLTRNNSSSVSNSERAERPQWFYFEVILFFFPGMLRQQMQETFLIGTLRIGLPTADVYSDGALVYVHGSVHVQGGRGRRTTQQISFHPTSYWSCRKFIKQLRVLKITLYINPRKFIKDQCCRHFRQNCCSPDQISKNWQLGLVFMLSSFQRSALTWYL